MMNNFFKTIVFIFLTCATFMHAQEEKEKKPKEGWHVRGYYTLCNIVAENEGYFRETFNEIGVAAGWGRNRLRFNVKYTWDLQISKFQEYSLLYGREIPLYDKLTLDLYGGFFILSETEEIAPRSLFEAFNLIRTDGVLKYELSENFYVGLTAQLPISTYNIWFYGVQMQYKL